MSGYQRTTINKKNQNNIRLPLVSRNSIILPPMHIKSLMKQFVKALDINEKCFSCITRKLPALSKCKIRGKIRAGIFDGLQIRILLKDTSFLSSMNDLERPGCTSFVEVTKNFLGNYKSYNNYSEIVNERTSEK
jgi:hypothetical protein